jgi:GH18 family chitinase
VKKKAAYAESKELGGLMIWELGQDSDNMNSLLKAIREEVK